MFGGKYAPETSDGGITAELYKSIPVCFQSSILKVLDCQCNWNNAHGSRELHSSQNCKPLIHVSTVFGNGEELDLKKFGSYNYAIRDTQPSYKTYAVLLGLGFIRFRVYGLGLY